MLHQGARFEQRCSRPGARFSTLCFLFLGLSRVIFGLNLTGRCWPGTCFSNAHWLTELTVYGRPRLQLCIAKTILHNSWTFAILLLLLGGDVEINPGPEVFPGTAKQPTFVSVNLNGLCSKKDAIESELIALHCPQLIALQETKLGPKTITSELEIAGYSLFRCDRVAGGGGVAVLAATSLCPRFLKAKKLAPKMAEIVAIQANFRDRCILFASIYANPDLASKVSQEKFTDFLDSLADFLASLGAQLGQLVLVGDVNLDPSANSDRYKQLRQLLDSFGLYSILAQPTHGGRTLRNGQTTPLRQLDHIFVGSPLLGGKCHLSPPLERDVHGHATVLWKPISLSILLRTGTKFSVKLYRNMDKERARFLLLYNQNGTTRDLGAEVLAQDSAESAALFLVKQLSTIYTTCTPNTTIKSNGKFRPRLPSDLVNLIRKKNRFHARRLFWTAEEGNQCKHLQKKIRYLLKKTRRDWAVNLLEESDPSPAGFWSAFRRISGLFRPSVPTLIQGDVIAVTEERKAALLSCEFQKNFSDKQFPPPVLRLGELQSEPLDLTCMSTQIHRILAKLNRSAAGIDEIPPAFLKEFRDDLSQPIAALLSKCLQESTFPKCLKRARIVPIPKVDSPSDPNEFRPVSILPALSKPLEKWLLDRIHNNIRPSELQFGFRAQSSCEDAIAAVQHMIGKGLQDCKGAARVAFLSLDVSRAFDQVVHNLLLKTLLDRGISHDYVALFQSYLAERQQSVSVGRHSSAEVPVPSGVPQGSVLGPSLFNAYVDTIFHSCQLSPGANIAMYCDDTIYIKALSSPSAVQEANEDLLRLKAAFSNLHLSLNPQKSKLLVITADNRPSPRISLSLGETTVNQVQTLKYLGVYFDEKLKFNQHVSVLATRMKRETGALYRMFGKFVPSATFLQVVRQKLVPQLTYGLAVVAPRCKYSWTLLEKAQRFALRLALNDYVSSYADLLSSSHFVSISQLYMTSCARLVYKYFYGLRYFPFHGELIVLDNNTRNLRNRASNHIFLRSPVSNNCLNVVREMPVYRIISTWNLLSDNVVSYGFSQFKSFISSDTCLFDRFCAFFNSRLSGSLSLFKSL